MYREYPVPAALSRWVECAWSVDTMALESEWPVRPDGCIDIVYSRADGLSAVGAMTSARYFSQLPGDFYSGIRFRPGMARDFLRVPSSELTDRMAPLGIAPPGAIPGGKTRELENRLNDASSSAQCAALLAGFLAAPAHGPSPVQRAIAAITAAGGCVDLDRIAAGANLSARHFRRLCLQESGLSPKQLCRVLRFQAALRRAGAVTGNGADLAAESGYFDQSHLIRDFREFAGETPMAVFSNRLIPAKL